MHIEREDIIPHSADLVYPLMRDRLTELLPFLPNIETVEQVSSERVSDTEVKVVNRWRAKSQLPAMAAKFLPADLFVWMDHAHWYDDRYQVEYRLEGFGYEGKGTNTIAPSGAGTKLHIVTDVVIDPKAFKIPTLVFNKIFPLVEDSVKRAIEPNITALAHAVKQYFEQG